MTRSSETSAEPPEPELQPAIAHVLLIDIVAYSRLLVNEQIEAVRLLNEIARKTATFRAAEQAGKLTRLPTGDGMALLFFDGPESPVRCALEIAGELRTHPHLQVRMGAHSGAVSTVTDVNDRANVAGAGINVAHRVMDCGDAGHILLSKQLAENLAQYRHWQPYLHDLGKAEVKHGVEVELVNLHKDGLGNPAIPLRVRRPKQLLSRTAMVPAAAILLALVVGLSMWRSRSVSPPLEAEPLPPAEGNAHLNEQSIAVLPFRAISRDEESARLAEGIHDVVLTTLAGRKGLHVTSQGSVLNSRLTALSAPAKGLALGVRTLLEGSIQRDGEQFRVDAWLLEAPSGKVSHAQSFTGREPLRLQKQVAQFAAQRLGGTAAHDQRLWTENLAAYESFLSGSEWERRPDGDQTENAIKAAEAYERAIQLDPQFTRAEARLAYTYARIFWQASQSKLQETFVGKAQRAVEHLLQTAPESPYAQAALGFYHYYCHADYAQAADFLSRAREALPNDSEIAVGLGLVQRRLAHWNESVANLTHATRLDPLNARFRSYLADTFEGMRRYDEALAAIARIEALGAATSDVQVQKTMILFKANGTTAELRQVLQTIDPADESALAGITRYQLNMFERRYDDAVRDVERSNLEMFYSEWGLFPKDLLLALTYSAQGELARAQKHFERSRAAIEADVLAGGEARLRVALALACAGLGRTADALQHGNLAKEKRSTARDAVAGPPIAATFARVCTMIGEKEAAIRELELSLMVPFGLTANQLRFDPAWDPLRGDPRFQRLAGE